MEYTTLGSTGVTVSRLCFGTWRFGKESGGGIETDRGEAHELLDAAWNRGINFIDTANSYGGGDSERYIGEWLADYDREDFVIASKVYWATRGVPEKSLSRKRIRSEVGDTLERLDTDYLDLYYVHAWHPDSPIDETLSTLNDLVREGTVHHLAISNVAAWQLVKSLWTSDRNDWERFAALQPKFNAAHREPVADRLDVCADQDLAVCPYSPLAGGFLTGKYERTREGGVDVPDGSRASRSERFGEFSDAEWAVLETVTDVAEEVGATPAQVALRWLIDQKRFTCVPIVGARSVDQLEENVGAVDLELSSDQHDRLTTAGLD